MRSSILIALCLSLAACSGADKGAQAHWTVEPEETTRPVRETEALSSPTPLTPEVKAQPPMLGVRHDLMLSKTEASPCACLAVHVGRPDDPAFFWTGGAPNVGPNALAVAISARGVACPGDPRDEAQRHPSISAIDQVNDDIVIEVEELPEGPPQASGAIIPAPGQGGAIYIRPRNNQVVYAKSAEGRCKVR